MLLQKTNEIRKALEIGLYNCALALTLTLPDICGKVELPNERSVAYRYKKWFNNYAKRYFTQSVTELPSGKIVPYVWFSAEECYDLRCAVLHSGSFSSNCYIFPKIIIHANKNSSCDSFMIHGSKIIDWDVLYLCNTLCNAAEEYYHNAQDKSLFYLNEVVIKEFYSN